MTYVPKAPTEKDIRRLKAMERWARWGSGRRTENGGGDVVGNVGPIGPMSPMVGKPRRYAWQDRADM